MIAPHAQDPSPIEPGACGAIWRRTRSLGVNSRACGGIASCPGQERWEERRRGVPQRVHAPPRATLPQQAGGHPQISTVPSLKAVSVYPQPSLQDFDLLYGVDLPFAASLSRARGFQCAGSNISHPEMLPRALGGAGTSSVAKTPRTLLGSHRDDYRLSTAARDGGGNDPSFGKAVSLRPGCKEAPPHAE